MAITKIEWATDRWNPITGCPGPKVSPGCDNCYAERMSKRLAGRYGYDRDDPFGIHVHHERWIEPFGWKKPRRVFVCTMGDLFHPAVSDSYIAMIFAMAAHLPQHTFILLTKRPQRMLEFIGDRSTLACDRRGFAYQELARESGRDSNMDGLPWPLKNLWLGITITNQREADERLTPLEFLPGWNYWLCCEPMLGPLVLQPRHGLGGCMGSALKWVVCGGETGPKARAMHPTWVRNLRDQCRENEVPFFFKSWGEWCPTNRNKYNMWSYPHQGYLAYDLPPGQLPGPSDHCGCWGPEKLEAHGCAYVCRVGKKAAGRLLDGREWNEVPE